MEIIFECSDKMYLYLKKLKKQQTTVECEASYSDIIEESLLSYYDISLSELNDIDIAKLGDMSVEKLLSDTGMTNLFSNYVYIYMDPRYPETHNINGLTLTHRPIYVGKGQHERYKGHLCNAKNKKLKTILDELKRDDIFPFIEIVHKNLSNLEAYRIENNLIYLMTESGIALCNSDTITGNHIKEDINFLGELNLELNELSLILNCLNSTRTVKDAAKKMKISERSLYRKIKSNSIKKDKNRIFYVNKLS